MDVVGLSNMDFIELMDGFKAHRITLAEKTKAANDILITAERAYKKAVKNEQQAVAVANAFMKSRY